MYLTEAAMRVPDVPLGSPYPIDFMPALASHLGRSKVERIRFASKSSHTYSAKRNTPNPILAFMQAYKPHDGSAVDDIMMGIARLDHHSNSSGCKPLSVSRMFNILQCMEVINTPAIEDMLGVETRQAQKYLKAVKMAIFHIQRHRNKNAKEEEMEPLA